MKTAKSQLLFAADTIVGDIADALAPSLFSERRALIIRDLQDLPEDNQEEVTALSRSTRSNYNGDLCS